MKSKTAIDLIRLCKDEHDMKIVSITLINGQKLQFNHIEDKEVMGYDFKFDEFELEVIEIIENRNNGESHWKRYHYIDPNDVMQISMESGNCKS